MLHIKSLSMFFLKLLWCWVTSNWSKLTVLKLLLYQAKSLLELKSQLLSCFLHCFIIPSMDVMLLTVNLLHECLLKQVKLTRNGRNIRNLSLCFMFFMHYRFVCPHTRIQYKRIKSEYEIILFYSWNCGSKLRISLWASEIDK